MRTDALTPFIQGWRHFLLPPRCLLCSATGANGIDLCADCNTELPRNPICCKRCALPLAMPADLCG
ncbi:MAG: double zinc ribbon domain-containing protein, partial [Pseudomonadota bacterium]|nr:double zinc ribbon domain-containing protein [Pseudomonadota bacterium]